MTTPVYVFLAVFVLSVAASFTVPEKFLPLKILKKFLSALIFPFLYAAGYFILYDFMPYSFHIIIRAVISLIFVFSASVLTTIQNDLKKDFYNLICILKGFSLIPFIELYRTIFYQQHISLFLIILLISILVLMMIFMIIFMKNQSLSEYLCTVFQFISASVFNFVAFMLLFHKSGLFSAFLFAGSFIYLLKIVFKAVNRKHLNLKPAPYIISGTYILSQVFILVGTILMISGTN